MTTESVVQRRKRPRDTWAARLAWIRHDMQLTQGEIAGLCGVAPATWSTWERGAVPRDKSVVSRRIARATGYDLEWLLWDPDEPDPTNVTGRFPVRVRAQERISPFRPLALAG